MNRIKIYMCCHKQYETVPPLCEPVLCGADINAAVNGAVPDNTGDNISAKNREYCELTAHYFVWKNVQADYYGFCHYRRFFSVNGKTKRPYLAKGRLTDSAKKQLLGNEQQWRELIEKYDIIVPRSEDMGIPANEHYISSAYHYRDDLQLFLQILNDHAPEYKDAAHRYLSQSRQYFCNMFIMNAGYFNSYCEILFAVLAEFDRQKTLHGDFQSDRTDGYLGEIFTGIFVTYCRENNAHILELPRLDVECSLKKRIGCALFPPESRRRFMIKKIIKRLRRK